MANDGRCVMASGGGIGGMEQASITLHQLLLIGYLSGWPRATMIEFIFATSILFLASFHSNRRINCWPLSLVARVDAKPSLSIIKCSFSIMNCARSPFSVVMISARCWIPRRMNHFS